MTPSFLESKLYVDFRNDEDFDKKYEILLKDIKEVHKFLNSETFNDANLGKKKDSINDHTLIKPKLKQSQKSTPPKVEYKTFTDIEPDISNNPFAGQFRDTHRKLKGRSIQSPRFYSPLSQMDDYDNQIESDVILNEIWEKSEKFHEMHGVQGMFHSDDSRIDSFGNIMRREEYGCQTECGWVVAKTVEIDDNGKEQTKNIEAMNTKKFMELSDSY